MSVIPGSHAQVRRDTHIHIHTYIRTYIHTYIHAGMHAYIHTLIHTYIHTHTYITIRLCWVSFCLVVSLLVWTTRVLAQAFRTCRRAHLLFGPFSPLLRRPSGSPLLRRPSGSPSVWMMFTICRALSMFFRKSMTTGNASVGTLIATWVILVVVV